MERDDGTIKEVRRCDVDFTPKLEDLVDVFEDKDQVIAKALTYYENSSKNNKAFALTQAYIWACGKGKSKQTVVYQAGKNLDSGYSTSDAKKFCKKINDSYPEGTIYYYNVKKCVKGKKHNSHQKLYRLDASSPHEHPKHKSLKESYQDTKQKRFRLV